MLLSIIFNCFLAASSRFSSSSFILFLFVVPFFEVLFRIGSELVFAFFWSELFVALWACPSVGGGFCFFESGGECCFELHVSIFF